MICAARGLGVGVRVKVWFKPLEVIPRVISRIRWCMKAYAGVAVVTKFGPVLFGPYDLGPAVLGAKPPTQFRHRGVEKNHSAHFADSEPASRLPNSLGPSAQLRSTNVLRLWCHAVGDRTPGSGVPSGRSNH